MRNGQNKRMRGRNRNKPHHGGHHHNPLTRVYESNGPDVKIRGTAHHVAEKYLQLARDAQTSGDPVTAENHFQHAEHYYRLIAAAQEQLRQQNPYYQPTALPGEGNRDEPSDGDDEEASVPIPSQPNFGGQPQPYPPREQPQPYGGQQPPQQGRAPHQPYQQYQPQQQAPQPYQPPQQQAPPASADLSDGGRLPSFITGSQPQQSPQGPGPNGYDGQGGERFPRHRRRRHRGGPRPDTQNAAQDFRGDDGPDDPSPGNS
jgi:hypothetical protein